MPEDQLLTIKEAGVLLRVTERTIRRYVRQGVLSKVYVQGRFGQEIRLNKDEVLKLSQVSPSQAKRGGQRGHDLPQDNRYLLDITQLWQKLETVQREKEETMARMGWLQGKLDAQENEIKLLAAGKEEVLKEKQQLEAQSQRLSQERAEAQRRAKELQEALTKEQTEWAQKTRQHEQQLRRLRIALLILLLLFAGFLFAIPSLDRILSGIRQWL